MKVTLDIDLTSRSVTVNGERRELRGDNAARAIANLAGDYLAEKCRALDGVFNKDVYWPEELQMVLDWTMRKRYEVIPTRHLMERLDMYRLPFRSYTAMLYGEIVEAELTQGVVTKIVTRLRNRYDRDEDLCAAILLRDGEAVVATMWVNSRYDKHFTLHRKNYIDII